MLPPPSSPAQSPCLCSSDATKYASFSHTGDTTVCFAANDMTNLQVMLAGLPTASEVRDFYTRCNDYDNDGAFQANDLTSMLQVYAGQLGVAPWVTER